MGKFAAFVERPKSKSALVQGGFTGPLSPDPL